MFNYPSPTIYHYITVEKRGEKARTEKAYTFPEGRMEGKGEDWWTTYRYQLEAFIDKLKGRTPQTWLDKEDAVANMEWIEQIYAKVSRCMDRGFERPDFSTRLGSAPDLSRLLCFLVIYSM